MCYYVLLGHSQCILYTESKSIYYLEGIIDLKSK
jgi:hypothetical protein